MRITVDLPGPLYRKLKAAAARQKTTLGQLVMRAVERELNSGAEKKGRVQLPLVKSKEPGALRLTSEQIYQIIPFP